MGEDPVTGVLCGLSELSLGQRSTPTLSRPLAHDVSSFSHSRWFSAKTMSGKSFARWISF